jgi:3-phosphoshikimate 1-carboxyvinyltransferase
MTSLRISRSGPLRGRVKLPGDRELGQEALLWAALADTPSCIAGLAEHADHRTLIHALRAMGVPIAHTEAGVRVSGVGLDGLKLPSGALSAGASSSTLELLTILLSAQTFGTRIEAQGAAREHSLRTVIAPLRARGAHVRGRESDDGDMFAPVSAAPRMPGEALSEVEIQIPDGDAATKRAMLLSGLYARGITAVAEGMLSRDHTERALVALGVPVQTLGGMTLLDTSEAVPRWPGFDWTMPGDATLFAYLSALVLSVPGSDVTFEGVLLNPSRSSWLEVLTHAGANVQVTPKGDAAGNEALGDVRVRASRLRALRIGGELAFRMLDHACALLILTPALGGRASIRDITGLRTGPRATLKRAVQLVRAFGGECTDYEDGFDLDPVATRKGTTVSLSESPELGLVALSLGLVAEGATHVHAAQALDALYPGVVDVLVSLGARVEPEEAPA